ncbi:MAG: ATP-binding protein [Synergistaceae bacterium]|nr:ATP-binding protein [Synergistaceae bacterium]
MRNSLGQRKFLSMLAVSSTEMVLTIIALLADTVIAGHAAGEAGLSAMNIMTPFVSVMAFIGGLISMGVSFTYGEAMGRADKKRADGLFGMSLILAVAFGLVMFLLVSVLRDEYFAFIKPDAGVMGFAVEYLRFFRFVMIIDPLAMLLGVMVYNDGDELISNIANLTNIAGNIVLSLFFAFTLKMGIAGIALGTLMKDVVSLAVLSCHFMRKTNSLHPRLHFSFSDLWDFVKRGFIDSGMYLMLGVMLFVMNKFVIAQFGGEYLPVLSMAVSLIEVSVVFDGIAQAMLPLVSVYHAEGNSPAVRKVITLAAKVSVIEGVAFSAVMIVFAEYVPAMFGIDEPETVRRCVSAVRIISTTLVVSSLLFLFETYYMILGKNGLAVISSCARNLIAILLISIPLGMTGSISGVWWGFALAQLFTLILCCALAVMKYGREAFPLYLEEKQPVADYDLLLSPEALMSVRDSAEEFLNAHGIPKDTVNQVMLIIEETGMLIIERNKGDVLAEYTIEVDEDERVRIIIRDDGEIFDVTDEDLNVTSLRSYVVSRLMTRQRLRRNITTTSFNRNVFNVRGGLAEKLIMR